VKRRFHKMHGLGNDFVIVDARDEPFDVTPALASSIADRRTGVGCDQLIVLELSETADLRMRIWNSDGGEVESCGNATRCVIQLTGAKSIESAGGLLEGKDVRMSGQDVKRGTFSHRHAVIRDENTDQAFSRLSQIPNAKGQFRIYNSLLSEYAVLGFEYGYSLANPNALVLWEAQFGDFSNGAQTIIDQFIASAEQKWNRMNGVVMLLPHGYEGQGPEHSSARMERFLQLCAELNLIVANTTTAANFFHLLRRQLLWPFRKPMINFSPKANLRLPATYSLKEEFIQGKFRETIDDTTITQPAAVNKVLFCSGKIYYDLADFRQKNKSQNVAIIRVEQLYPLPEKQLLELYNKYANATWFWVQEEPLNMGAASFLQMNLKTMNYGMIGRQPSASTATGYSKMHAQEQNEIIETAFEI